MAFSLGTGNFIDGTNLYSILHGRIRHSRFRNYELRLFERGTPGRIRPAGSGIPAWDDLAKNNFALSCLDGWYSGGPIRCFRRMASKLHTRQASGSDGHMHRHSRWILRHIMPALCQKTFFVCGRAGLTTMPQALSLGCSLKGTGSRLSLRSA